jgi:hypothetical protein
MFEKIEMKKFLSLFILVVTSCQNPPQAPPVAADPADRVENSLTPAVVIEGRPVETYNLQERVEYYGVPGVSIALFDNFEIEWARGYGYADVAAKRPVTPSTLFQAASISKPVAAMAALKLVEEGRLELDADVNTALQSWRVPDNELVQNELFPESQTKFFDIASGMEIEFSFEDDQVKGMSAGGTYGVKVNQPSLFGNRHFGTMQQQ